MLKSVYLKTIFVSLFLVLGLEYAYAATSNYTDDYCSQIDFFDHWQGNYAWTYRGDHFQLPATAKGTYLSAHHYKITMQIQNEPPEPLLELKGTCMDSQIYLEEDPSAKFPPYLQGTINDNGITLRGHRGPNIVTVTLKH